MKLPEPDSEFSKTCTRLMQRKMADLIGWDEYNREWAYLIVESMKNVYPKIHPHRPKEMTGYDGLSESDKMALGKDPLVRAYWSEVVQVENWNKAQLAHMVEALQYIPKEDVVTRGKLNERITRFQVEAQDAATSGAYRDYDGQAGRKVSRFS